MRVRLATFTRLLPELLYAMLTKRQSDADISTWRRRYYLIDTLFIDYYAMIRRPLPFRHRRRYAILMMFDCCRAR